MWRIFHIILAVPHNIVMQLNNVMIGDGYCVYQYNQWGLLSWPQIGQHTYRMLGHVTSRDPISWPT
jgi:hypothetical protein